MKSFIRVLLISVLGIGLLLGSVSFGGAQASTDVSGIISSDATWTEANSPYAFTGPVGVTAGVTLTLEAGTIVHSYGYYLQVNGTLIVDGSSSDPVEFGGGEIRFTDSSTDWDEQTGLYSIV